MSEILVDMLIGVSCCYTPISRAIGRATAPTSRQPAGQLAGQLAGQGGAKLILCTTKPEVGKPVRTNRKHRSNKKINFVSLKKRVVNAH